MSYLSIEKHPLEKYLPLLLSAFATVSTVFSLCWALNASLHLPL